MILSLPGVFDKIGNAGEFGRIEFRVLEIEQA